MESRSQNPFALILFVGFFIFFLQLSNLVGWGNKPLPVSYRTEDLVQVANNHPYLLFQAIPVNTAAPEQLIVIPGIGPELSRRIASYRHEHGPFQSLEELGRVSGIGPRKLASLKAYCRL